MPPILIFYPVYKWGECVTLRFELKILPSDSSSSNVKLVMPENWGQPGQINRLVLPINFPNWLLHTLAHSAQKLALVPDRGWILHPPVTCEWGMKEGREGRGWAELGMLALPKCPLSAFDMIAQRCGSNSWYQLLRLFYVSAIFVKHWISKGRSRRLQKPDFYTLKYRASQKGNYNFIFCGILPKYY